MNRKGFTLAELLAVVVVLGILVVIISPTVKKLVGDSTDTLGSIQVDMIVNAARKYMVDNNELLPEPDGAAKFVVYVADLVSGGVIDGDKVIDPKSNEKMGGCVIVSYNDSYNQYEYNYRSNCSVTVTFDANGGSVSQGSKEVLIGRNYGDLPTPTRSGYTFKGWNGKNMLNLDVSESAPSNTASVNTTDRIFTENSYVVGLAYNNYFKPEWVSSLNIASDTLNFITKVGYGVAFPVLGSSSKSYTLSYDGVLNGGNSSSIPISSLLFYKSDGSLISFNRLDGAGHKVNTFVAPNNTYYVVAAFVGNGQDTNLSFSKIQLEEASSATEYESFYVTRDVKVTQELNHTLKAIWELD